MPAPVTRVYSAAARYERFAPSNFEEIIMTQQHFIVGVYTDEQTAHTAVETAIAAGCPMDKLSVLGKLQVEGDDVLGIVHPGVGKRMEVWGAHGAFWGGMAGLLAASMGVFWLPAVGPVIAVGHLVGAFATGVVGSVVGGTGLAGAAAISQLAVALHRHGLPEATLEVLHKKIEQGHYLIILQTRDRTESDRFRELLSQGQVQEVLVLG
jgi:hypothetical protein